MNLIEYADRELMMIDLANQIAEELENTLLHEDRASLAVAGGTTPGPVFDSLCAADIEWARVDVMLSDERWVPESSPRSNTRLVKTRLLKDRAAAANWIPLYVDGPAPEAAIVALSEPIRACLPISVVLLGMGADMHTASLFPGADRLREALSKDAPELLAMRAPGAGEPRVTLSARVLNDAISKHIVITGIEKKEALLGAGRLPAEEAPVTAVWDGATIHWAA